MSTDKIISNINMVGVSMIGWMVSQVHSRVVVTVYKRRNIFWKKAIHGMIFIESIRYLRHTTWHDVIEISHHESMILCKFCCIASCSIPIYVCLIHQYFIDDFFHQTYNLFYILFHQPYWINLSINYYIMKDTFQQVFSQIASVRWQKNEESRDASSCIIWASVLHFKAS